MDEQRVLVAANDPLALVLTLGLAAPTHAVKAFLRQPVGL